MVVQLRNGKKNLIRMIKLVSAHTLFISVDLELKDFMEKNSLLIEDTVKLPKRDYSRLVKIVFDLSSEGYRNTVFIKPYLSWNTCFFGGENNYFNRRMVEIFEQKISKLPNYIDMQFESYPDLIFDVENDLMDGELREALIKIKI